MQRIITRGFGTNSGLVSQGYGGSFFVIVSSVGFIQSSPGPRPLSSHGGRRSKSSDNNEVINLLASLIEVNGVEVMIPKSATLRFLRGKTRIDVLASRKNVFSGPTVSASVRR